MAQKALSRKVKRQVNDYISTLRQDKLPLKQVIIFGSQVKGKVGRWSDIDVCVISSKFKDSIDALQYLMHKAREAKIAIEPHPYHPKDFINEDPLVWEIK